MFLKNKPAFSLRGCVTAAAIAGLLLLSACGDGDDDFFMQKANKEDVGTSSSSKTPKSSSSSDGKSCSSSIDTSAIHHGGNVFRWDGTASEYRVNTGLDNGTETSGYWYSFDDNVEGGLSAITWPVEIDDYFLDAFDPVIDMCGGICGEYELDAGILDYHPFVGLAFNVAGANSSSSDPFADADVADASAWGGLCISYTLDADATLELSTGEPLYGYDLPYVNLPKSETGDELCFTWSQFRRAGWGKWGTKGKETGDEAAETLATVIIQIQRAGGSTGKFNIMSIGSYN